MALNPAVEVSYLKPEEQKGLLEAMKHSAQISDKINDFSPI